MDFLSSCFNIHLSSYFVKLDPRATIPQYKTLDSACCDLYLLDRVTLPCREVTKVPLGLIAIPPEGYHWEIHPRSSMMIRYPGLFLANLTGIIDSDYCGPTDELALLLYNSTAEDIYIREEHERLAQMQLVKNIVPSIQELTYEEYGRMGLRSRRGFGSTGR